MSRSVQKIPNPRVLPDKCWFGQVGLRSLFLSPQLSWSFHMDLIWTLPGSFMSLYPKGPQCRLYLIMEPPRNQHQPWDKGTWILASCLTPSYQEGKISHFSELQFSILYETELTYRTAPEVRTRHENQCCFLWGLKINLQKSESDIKIYRVRKKKKVTNRINGVKSKQAPLFIFMFFWFLLGFPSGSAGKDSACNVGDLSSIPRWGRYPGEGNG